MEQKKIFIKSYGCQMNVYDSDRMLDLMAPLGYSESKEYIDSDIVVLNTCHIREKAAEKVYSELGRIRQQKQKRKAEGRNMIVVVAGCVAQAEGQEIFSRSPVVDIVVGPQSYQNLPLLIEKVNKGGRSNGLAIDLDFPEISKFDLLPEPKGGKVSEFLSIQEGCDQFCTFCVVPYTRGAEYSRNVPDVYREALKLASNGAAELTLLGQNVNAYHGKGGAGDEDWNLAKLIKHIAKIPGIQRIRYTTSHPLDMDDELIALHGEEEKLMPFLHLPVQAGSNKILKAMNRKHERDYYYKVIERLRASRPDISFSSDFIVGFPGETDADFEETMQLIRDIKYAQSYSFKYSPRPGTPAADKENQIPEDVKSERLWALQALVNSQQEEYNASFIGKDVEVLFDRKGKKPNEIIGKSPHMQSVHVKDAAEYEGKLARVKIKEGGSNSIAGEIVELADNNVIVESSHTAGELRA